MAETRVRRAAQYLRMSTDHQRYSLDFQAGTNTAYALEHRLELARTYTDAGVSGLSLARRDGLKSLLADILGGVADFDVVLVYDVSRWGRFQDPDQAAHYEFVCREAGVEIVYTAEPFANDGSLSSTLVKHMKRAMAAEYSRELSAKVSRAQKGLRAQGYWMGGQAGFGLRRQMVGPDGVRGSILETHQRKAIQGDRCVLVPGPATEVSAVRQIFTWYGRDGVSIPEIASRLNARKVRPEAGGAWNGYRVRQVLGSEKYIGTLVAGRQIYFLRKPKRCPRSAWTRVYNALDPLISPALFAAVQRRLHPHKPWIDDEGMVRELRGVLKRHGRLSRIIIDRDPDAHCTAAFVRRFGDLLAAYARAGYMPEPRQIRAAETAVEFRPWVHSKRAHVDDDDLIRRLRDLLETRGALSVAIINDEPEMPGAEVYRDRFGGMRRAYALAGYKPSRWQERIMDLRPGQSLDRASATRLRTAELANGGHKDGV